MFFNPARYRYWGFVALAASATLCADELSIDVSGVKTVDGALMVALYDAADAWNNDDEAIATTRQRVRGQTARIVFADLPAGTYAVMLFHDVNANGELDKNMLGVPSESYGFSNNAGRFGKPDFKEAQINVRGGTSISIELR